MRRVLHWIARKRADFHSARRKILTLAAYEIVTPLTVEACLIRLTGRTPPFGEPETIARPHPFTGLITGDRITLDAKYPYSIVGNVAEEGSSARVRLALVLERNRTFGYLFSAFSYTLFVLLFCVAIPYLLDAASPSQSIIMAFAYIAILMSLLPLISIWMDKRSDARQREDAPDVSDTIQVFANLVRATEVKTLHPDSGQATLDLPRVEAR